MSFFREEKDSLKTKEESVSNSFDENSAEIMEEETATNLIFLEDNVMNMKVISTVNEIDKLYKQGVLQYTQSIHRYNIEIEKLKNEIEIESKKNTEEQRRVFTLESVLDHECKLFDKLQHKFTQKVESLVELRDEYQESLDEKVYREKLFTKERELFSLLDEIEEKEMDLLNQELDKINFSNILGKKLKKLEELITSLKELELEKSYFESTELQKLSYFNPEQLALKNESQIVDTEVLET